MHTHTRVHTHTHRQMRAHTGVRSFNMHAYTVSEITSEKWVDTLSGHDKASMDIDRIVWT